MFKNAKKYVFRFVLLLSIAGLFATCKNRAYNYNNGVAPQGIAYSYYKYGTGTSFMDGALVINIHSNSSSSYYQYYIVKIFGVGTYNMQPGTVQLFIPNVWANYYDFSVERVCTTGSNNTNCYPLTLTGTAAITVETTTVADVWF